MNLHPGLQGSGLSPGHSQLSQQHHPACLARVSADGRGEVCRAGMFCGARQAPFNQDHPSPQGELTSSSLEEPFPVVWLEPGRSRSLCWKQNWTSYASGKGSMVKGTSPGGAEANPEPDTAK